jgi:arylsulfatase A-like enzyme
VFEKAYTVSSWTLPSHASLFTGKLPSVHGADFSYFWLDSSEKTMAEYLQEKGYITAGFIGGPFLLSTLNVAQGFAYYEDSLDPVSGVATLMLVRIARRLTGMPLWWMDRQNTAGELTDHVLTWLSRSDNPQPFFLFINYFDPHDPYRPPAPFDSLYDPGYHGPMNGATRPLYSNRKTGERKKGGKNGPPLDAQDYRHLKALYDGEIRYMDQEIGRLFDALEREGLLKNSILILTADHGESIGEHKLVDHGHSLYEEQVHIPLILAGPGIPPGKRISSIVSNIDVLPTLMEMLGFNAPQKIEGRSFVPNLLGQEDAGRAYYGEIFEDPHTRVAPFKRELKAITDDGWKLIHSSAQPPELYNLEADPAETADALKTQPAQGERLQMKLRDKTSQIVPKTDRKQAPLDQSTLESLEANGYIN